MHSEARAGELQSPRGAVTASLANLAPAKLAPAKLDLARPRERPQRQASAELCECECEMSRVRAAAQLQVWPGPQRPGPIRLRTPGGTRLEDVRGPSRAAAADANRGDGARGIMGSESLGRPSLGRAGRAFEPHVRIGTHGAYRAAERTTSCAQIHPSRTLPPLPPSRAPPRRPLPGPFLLAGRAGTHRPGRRATDARVAGGVWRGRGGGGGVSGEAGPEARTFCMFKSSYFYLVPGPGALRQPELRPASSSAGPGARS